MRKLLAVPDTAALAPDLIRQILERFDGLRVDVAHEDHGRMWAQAYSLAAHECFVIYLLFGGDMTRDDGEPWEPEDMLQHTRNQCQKLEVAGYLDRELAIEFGNEPDLAHKRFKKNPRELGDLYGEAMRIVWSYSKNWHCLSPSISNLDEDSLDYLRKMNLPPGSEIAFHRYPPAREFWSAHRGFKGRTGEVDALKSIAKGAKLWHTEGGWAELNRDYTLTELEVAERMADEVRFWRDQGVECWTAYQLNSGTWKASDSDDVKRLNTYGARRVDGSWKPWAQAVKEAMV